MSEYSNTIRGMGDAELRRTIADLNLLSLAGQLGDLLVDHSYAKRHQQSLPPQWHVGANLRAEEVARAASVMLPVSKGRVKQIALDQLRRNSEYQFAIDLIHQRAESVRQQQVADSTDAKLARERGRRGR